MIDKISSFKNYARLLLDLPYRCGYQHIKAAFTGIEKISELAQAKLQIQPETQPRRLTLKEKAIHLILGISECVPIIGIVITCVEKYFQKSVSKLTFDPHKLIAHQQKIEQHQYSWHLNLALLRSAYDAATGDQKEQIKFLAANYLNNVTPKQLDLYANELKEIDPHYLTKHQGGPIEEYRYHRETIEQRLEYGKKINQSLAYGDQTLFILTDTIELDHLFPLRFTVVNSKETSATLIQNVLQDHFSKNPKEALKQPLRRPFLLDVTHLLDKSIQDKGFTACFENFKKEFEAEAIRAIDQLMIEQPDLSEFKSEIKKHLDENVTCITRVSIDGAAGIKMLPIGSSTTKENQYHSPLIHFVINTGLYIGAVNLRKLITDVFQQRKDVHYAVKGSSSTLYYPRIEDFTRSALFNRLLCLFGSQPASPNSACGIDPRQLDLRIERMAAKPHMKVLGKATMDLLLGVAVEINPKRWNQLNHDPVLAPIVQTSLVLIKEHLAAAEQYALADNFNQFAQEIELVHAQLATLLELTKPFQEKDFSSIYKKKLLGRSVPQEMHQELKVGLCKTAVNFFAGLAAAAKGDDAVLQGVTTQGSYYEEAMLMEHYFDHYIQDKSKPKLKFYLGQFNSNVDVGSTLTEYKRRDIASDVRKLLDDDRVSENFTVAVDLTIEEFDSPNVKQLLSQFKEEIKAGKVNFAFFSSGQKFYTLGMDNYYGSYFYMVNNNDQKWKAFDSLFTHPAYRTDSLSAQWFCLATKYASDSLANYRKLIFDNTRYILDRMPKSLEPGSVPNQKLRVNKVHADMLPCFVDLKVLGSPDDQAKRCAPIQNSLFKMMVKRGMNFYSRGSFGFYHLNSSVFGPLDDHARTIRLNPGINPEENDAIVEFYHSLAE